MAKNKNKLQAKPSAFPLLQEEAQPAPQKYKLYKLQLSDGTIPFDRYLKKQRNEQLEAKIERRLRRDVSRGVFGDIKPLGGILHELRFRKAEPETRVYIAKMDRDSVIIILCAGGKDDQQEQIQFCRNALKGLKNGNGQKLEF